jgi:hypothetical protein
MIKIRRNRLTILLVATLVGSVLVSFVSWRALAYFLTGTSEISGSISLVDKSSSGWFLLHPVLAIIGTVALPVPGVIIRKYKGYWSKKVHALFFFIAISAILSSLYVVYSSKEAKRKAHLQSYHALLGLSLALGYAGMAMIANMALDPDTGFIKHLLVRPWLKWIHTSGGRLLLVFGYWICLTGWYKFFTGLELFGGAFVALVASILTLIDVEPKKKIDDKSQY